MAATDFAPKRWAAETMIEPRNGAVAGSANGEKIGAVDTMASRALMFAVLIGVRTSEATDAQSGEIDFEAKLWTIPGPRMKMRKTHIVALSRQAI
jgi:integrase